MDPNLFSPNSIVTNGILNGFHDNEFVLSYGIGPDPTGTLINLFLPVF